MADKAIATARESVWRLGFWIRIVFTLGLYYFSWRQKYLRLTERRLEYRVGVFSRQEKTALLRDVLDVSVSQDALGRLFNYGDIAIETGGSPETEFYFNNASSPTEFREAVFRQKERIS